MSELNYIAVNDCELEDAFETHDCDIDQALLLVCKRKGMPVIGTSWLSPDPAYTFKVEYDPLRCRTKYRWKPLVLPS